MLVILVGCVVLKENSKSLRIKFFIQTDTMRQNLHNAVHNTNSVETPWP